MPEPQQAMVVPRASRGEQAAILKTCDIRTSAGVAVDGQRSHDGDMPPRCARGLSQFCLETVTPVAWLLRK